MACTCRAPLLAPQRSQSCACAGQSAETQALFSNPDVTLAELDAAVQTAAAGEGTGGMGGYGLSKCALTAFTMVQAKMYPNLVCTSLSPGFIDTNMTRVAAPACSHACPRWRLSPQAARRRGSARA